MASFDLEKDRVERLLARLGLLGFTLTDPGTAPETGIDVVAELSDGRRIGIQVTEIDPHQKPGKARKQENGLAKAADGRPYGSWAQNDTAMVLGAFRNAVEKKIKIAARYAFDGVDEVWLLMCGGVPEAPVSTFIMSSWISAADLDTVSAADLQASKYSQCFFLPIIGTEHAFYRWAKGVGWQKSTRSDEMGDDPRPGYVASLFRAVNQEELDRLTDAEAMRIWREFYPEQRGFLSFMRRWAAKLLRFLKAGHVERS